MGWENPLQEWTPIRRRKSFYENRKRKSGKNMPDMRARLCRPPIRKEESQSMRPTLQICTPENRVCEIGTGSCQERFNDGLFCTRAKGHEPEPHCACGNEHAHNLAVWPSTPPQPATTAPEAGAETNLTQPQGGDEPLAPITCSTSTGKSNSQPSPLARELDTPEKTESASNAAPNVQSVGAAAPVETPSDKLLRYDGCGDSSISLIRQLGRELTAALAERDAAQLQVAIKEPAHKLAIEMMWHYKAQLDTARAEIAMLQAQLHEIDVETEGGVDGALGYGALCNRIQEIIHPTKL